MSAKRADVKRNVATEFGEKGAVLVEWSIVGWGLVMGALIFFDTCNALNTYMTLANVAAQGALMAARVAELEPGAWTNLGTPSAADQASCDALETTPFPCGQSQIQQRIWFMVDYLTNTLSSSSRQITTEYIPPNTFNNEQDDTVKVTVSGSFEGIILRGIPIRASNQAPYLFRRG